MPLTVSDNLQFLFLPLPLAASPFISLKALHIFKQNSLTLKILSTKAVAFLLSPVSALSRISPASLVLSCPVSTSVPLSALLSKLNHGIDQLVSQRN